MRAGADRGAAPDAPGVAARRSRRRRAWLRGVAMLGVAVFAAAAVIAGLAWASPRWWPEVDASDPKIAAAGADLENEIASEMSRVRPTAAGAANGGAWRSGEWAVTISEGDATAWLSTRLGKWLASRDSAMPAKVRAIAVDFGEGEVRLGVEIGGSGRVISIEARPEISPDGALWLREVRLRAGRLPVPVSWVTGGEGERLLGGLAGDAGVFAPLSGRAPVTAEPLIQLGDGRVVRVLKIELREGEALVTCRTESARAGG